MKIYLVRHGQTDSNLKKVYDNVELDEDINENGIKQAEELRNKIMNIKFDIIYSSQLKRAIHTANIINYNNNKIIIDKRLEERNTGNKVLAVIGGFHLRELDEYMNKVIEYMKNNVEEVILAHCTVDEVCNKFVNDLKGKIKVSVTEVRKEYNF